MAPLANVTQPERIRPTTRPDRYGSPALDHDTNPVPLPPATFAPIPVAEDSSQGRQGRIIQFELIWVNSVPDLVATDRIRWNNHDWHIDGEPARYRHPRTRRDVLRAVVWRSEG